MQANESVPRGNLEGLARYWKPDLLAGFLVFLIALPLCLGISLASNFPPIAGIMTACAGGILCTFFSNSEMTIKGPAAGMIAIVSVCVMDFASLSVVQASEQPMFEAYRMAIAVGVTAGAIQIAFGLFRLGILTEFFPTAAVHGMLAAIGIIIASGQLHKVVGNNDVKGKALDQIAQLPQSLTHPNPEIAVIGVISLLILFGLPLIRNKYVRRIPGPMLVLLVAIPLGMYFDLDHEHKYLTFWDEEFSIGPKFLVTLPENLLDAITLPNFAALSHPIAWKWVLMFALVGSLESLLSAKAIDLIDPYKRRTNMNSDLLAIGVANTAVAFVGGLPMISEIVRSSANINNGARTRFANMYHGILLLLFVALFPSVIHSIPLAALGAMLVYTGFRLASPKEWANVYSIGREQLIVFTTTVVMTLATDLLIGIFSGIAMKLLIHLFNYAPIRSLFTGDMTIEQPNEKTYLVKINHAAIFCNWLALRRRLAKLDPDKDMIIDLSGTHLVDHTVMEKLHEMERDYHERQRQFHVIGLEKHQRMSSHPYAACKKTMTAPGTNGATTNGDVATNGDASRLNVPIATHT